MARTRRQATIWPQPQEHILAQAIIIDLYDTLTDESDNERNAIALLRQIVATAGVRVTEQGLKEAEAHSIESFAPDPFEAMIFRLVNRDTTMALRCISAFRKNFPRAVKIRPEAKSIVEACKQRGWKTALAQAPNKDEADALQKAGVLPLIDIKGPPPALKLALPDMRVLEFLLGQLGVMPGDCVMLGNRIDNDIRPAKNLRMTAVQVQVGSHGKRQLPRDLKDVPDYEAPDIKALLHVIPTVV
jgi:FMN phosphatase YigB (HAD superfamily)